jgi:hypothetical protein
MHYIMNAKLTQIPSYIIVGFFEKWAFLGCSTWLRKKSCPRVVFHLAEAAGTKGCVLWRYWEFVWFAKGSKIWDGNGQKCETGILCIITGMSRLKRRQCNLLGDINDISQYFFLFNTLFRHNGDKKVFL